MIVIGMGEAKLLSSLVDVHEEVFGSLMYARINAEGILADLIVGVVPNVVGSAMDFTVNRGRLRRRDEVVREKGWLGAVDFHTHTKTTVSLCGERSARELSDEDRSLIFYYARRNKEEGRHDYRHMLVTPEIMNVYGVSGGSIVQQRHPLLVDGLDCPLVREIEQLRRVYEPRFQAAGIPFCRSLDELAVTKG